MPLITTTEASIPTTTEPIANVPLTTVSLPPGVSNYYAFNRTIIDDSANIMNTVFAESNEDIMNITSNIEFPKNNTTAEDASLSAATILTNAQNSTKLLLNENVKLSPNTIDTNAGNVSDNIEIENINKIMKKTNQIGVLSRDMFPQEPRDFVQDMNMAINKPDTSGLSMNVYSQSADQYQAPWIGKTC
jgi:hypothetical protein